MDPLREHWRFGGVIMQHDKCRHKQCREKRNFFYFFWKKNFPNFFSTICGVIRLQVQDELQRTSPSRPARKKVVVDETRNAAGMVEF